MDITSRKVLCLNSGWQAIGVRTVKEIFVAMCGGEENNPPVKALDISYEKGENGEYDFNSQPSIIPVSWLEWLALPIREYDLVINSAKYKLRVPSVAVATNYSKIPKKRFRPNKSTLYNLQKGICGYTGEEISMNAGNLEHKIPKSLGGKETFENLMVVKKEINSARGNKNLDELGLRPLFKHREPAPIPASFVLNPNSHADWRWFLHK